MREQIIVTAYDPGWPETFTHEQVALAAACAGLPLAFEHIGSTAIPGLGAKPIVDIMGGLDPGANLNTCIEPIVALGYEYVAAYELGLVDAPGMPFRRFFKKRGRPGSFNLHVVHRGSNFWQRQIGFREYLRRDSATRDAYEQLKRELAPRFTDGNEYADAKSDFVEGVIRKLQISPQVRRIAATDSAALRRIRLAALTDAPDAFGSTLAEAEALSEASWKELALERSTGSDSIIYFAEDNAEPCGIVGGVRSTEVASTASLISMWVSPAHRRAGVGRMLVDTLVGWARTGGYSQVELWVTETNLAAISLYVAAGFEPTGRRQPLPSNPTLQEQMYRMIFETDSYPAVIANPQR